MTDAAKYKAAFRPEAQLSALYCRFHVPETVRVGLANRRILSVEMFAALGGAIADVMTAARALAPGTFSVTLRTPCSKLPPWQPPGPQRSR